MVKRTYKIFLALVVVFIAPGVLAFLFYKNPSWLGGLPTNKGVLVKPVTQVSYLPAENKGWHVLLWCQKGCDAECLGHLDELARMRLAMGRRLYNVNIWLLHPQTEAACSSDTQQVLKDQSIQYKSTAEHPINSADDAFVFLADPKGYLVLKYIQNTPVAKHIYSDLKHLMSTGDEN